MSFIFIRSPPPHAHMWRVCALARRNLCTTFSHLCLCRHPRATALQLRTPAWCALVCPTQQQRHTRCEGAPGAGPAAEPARRATTVVAAAAELTNDFLKLINSLIAVRRQRVPDRRARRSCGIANFEDCLQAGWPAGHPADWTAMRGARFKSCHNRRHHHHTNHVVCVCVCVMKIPERKKERARKSGPLLRLCHCRWRRRGAARG
jgi:hypothetical protein